MATIQQNTFGHISGSIYGVAGYTSDNDSTQHVIVATTDGTLYEIHWGPNISATAPLPLAHFDGLVCLTGFYTSDDAFQHVIVGINDNRMHEVYFQDPASPLVRIPLVQLKSIIGTGIGMSGYFSASDGLRHAAVMDKSGELHEVTFNAQQPPEIEDFATQFDLDQIASIAGFYAPDDNSRHTTVALRDGRIFDINYTTVQSAASTNFLTQFSERLVNVAAFFSSDTNFRHVIALTASGRVYDYSRSLQSEFGQTLLASFTNIVDMAAYYSAYDNNRHVIVATRDGNLHEIYYQHLGA